MTDYENLVKRLREIASHDGNIKSNYIGLTLLQAADAIEELTAFAHYVAKKAFDEEWELDPAFCELVCRKLNKIGIVEKDGEYWSYEPPKGGNHDN